MPGMIAAMCIGKAVADCCVEPEPLSQGRALRRYQLLMEAFGGHGYAVNSAATLADACRSAQRCTLPPWHAT